uniref:Transmembrane protein n=1 Tax=Oryza brachyantha TaxID=4533 RepID=J3L7B1_ORYBR
MNSMNSLNSEVVMHSTGSCKDAVVITIITKERWRCEDGDGDREEEKSLVIAAGERGKGPSTHLTALLHIFALLLSLAFLSCVVNRDKPPKDEGERDERGLDHLGQEAFSISEFSSYPLPPTCMPPPIKKARERYRRKKICKKKERKSIICVCVCVSVSALDSKGCNDRKGPNKLSPTLQRYLTAATACLSL